MTNNFIDKEIEKEFNDQFFVATEGRNDERRAKIKNSLNRLLTEIKKEMPGEKDESGDWSKRGYNEEMRVQGFNSCLEEVLKVLEKLETNPIN